MELIGEDAGPGIIDFLASFDRTRKNERFVILIDNKSMKTEKPADVIRELVELLEMVRYDWLKIVVTCRSVVWSVIQKSGLVIDKRLFVLSPAGDVAHVLRPFDDNELEQALERYSIVFGTHYPHRWADRHVYKERKLLRSPLILRFVFEAFRGKPEIPVFLDVQTIMSEFTKERLRERDLPFLQRYLMAYFSMRKQMSSTHAASSPRRTKRSKKRRNTRNSLTIFAGNRSMRPTTSGIVPKRIARSMKDRFLSRKGSAPAAARYAAPACTKSTLTIARHTRAC